MDYISRMILYRDTLLIVILKHIHRLNIKKCEEVLQIKFNYNISISKSQTTCKYVKGLVHPKIKIKSLITHPHAVPTL